MSDKSNNDKTKESVVFKKVEQKSQEAQGVKVIKSLDTSSAYPIIQRVLSELNAKSDSKKDK